MSDIMENQIENTVDYKKMDSNKTENIIIELTTNAETNAVTVKPAPKKRAPKKQNIIITPVHLHHQRIL
jgi:hypothetical protein